MIERASIIRLNHHFFIYCLHSSRMIVTPKHTLIKTSLQQQKRIASCRIAHLDNKCIWVFSQFTIQSGLGGICVNPFGAGDHLPMYLPSKSRLWAKFDATITCIYVTKSSRIRITTMHKDTIDHSLSAYRRAALTKIADFTLVMTALDDQCQKMILHGMLHQYL